MTIEKRIKKISKYIIRIFAKHLRDCERENKFPDDIKYCNDDVDEYCVLFYEVMLELFEKKYTHNYSIALKESCKNVIIKAIKENKDTNFVQMYNLSVYKSCCELFRVVMEECINEPSREL